MKVFKVIEVEFPSTCWKCKGRLILRGRGLYCPKCSRFRKFIVRDRFHLQPRGVRTWSYVDVRASGRQKRLVMLKRAGRLTK